MFIKRGDGKIMSIVKSEDELTDEQKKAVKDLSDKITKQSNETDASEQKKSGR